MILRRESQSQESLPSTARVPIAIHNRPISQATSDINVKGRKARKRSSLGVFVTQAHNGERLMRKFDQMAWESLTAKIHSDGTN